MRSHLILSFALAAGSLTACKAPEFSLGPNSCFSLDSPCGPYPPGGVVLSWIEGLPYDRVSSNAGWANLIPGDSVTLYLVSGPNGPPSADTVRTVTWGVTDSSVARVSPGQGGSGALVAVAPGTFKVTANGGTTFMSACIPGGCATFWEIRVVAPPAPTPSH